MSSESKIEWTDATWNPLTGCTLVSEGCRNCYAAREAAGRLSHRPEYQGLAVRRGGRPVFTGEIRTLPDRLTQPLQWRRPRRVFVNSMSDLFHPSVPVDFIDQVFAVMAIAEHHIFQVLTKRPARMRAYLTDEDLKARISGALGMMLDGDWIRREGKRHWPRIEAMIDAFIGVRVNDADLGHEHLQDPMPLPNVWLGTSVEDQVAANQRIPELMQTPAAVRFLSCEPLLGPVRLSAFRYDALQGHIRMRMGQHNAAGAWDEGDYMMHGYGTIHWVIVGGESGQNARPMHPHWARQLRDQCLAAGVPFLFKQWGEWNVASAENGIVGSLMPDTGERYTWLGIDGRTSNPSATGLPEPVYAMARLGKKAAGRHLDGRTWDEAPA